MPARARKKSATKKTVLAYIAKAAPTARLMLRQLRAVIRAAEPAAEETISYGIPYYSYHGRLIYFAAFKHHVSLYVMGNAKRLYAKEIKKYQTSMATLRFPFGTRLPITLVKKIVKARARENQAKAVRRTR